MSDTPDTTLAPDPSAAPPKEVSPSGRLQAIA